MARRGTQGRIGARLITTVLTHYTYTNDWETHTHLPHEQTRTATATPSNEQSNIRVSAVIFILARTHQCCTSVSSHREELPRILAWKGHLNVKN